MPRLQGLLALMHRSLRVDDRSLRTHLFRLVFLASTYFMLTTSQQQLQYEDAPGLLLFSRLCYVNFFFIMLAGVGLFASAIAEEKEDMTLGLLKMANVGPAALLLGKFIPRLVLAAVLLTAQVPFVMLAITLGGVDATQIIGAYLVLLAFLVLVSNLGLCCSVVCPSTRSASAWTTVILLLYLVGPLIILKVVTAMQSAGWIYRFGVLFQTTVQLQEFLYDTTACRQLDELVTTGGNPTWFHLQFVSNVIAGVALFVLAWLLFERSTRDSGASGVTRRRPIWRLGRPSGRPVFPGRPWRNAVLWKDFHFHAGGYAMAIVQLVVGLFAFSIVAGMQVYFEGRVSWEPNGAALMVGGICVAATRLAVLASRIIAEEVYWKTNTSLLLTPRGVASLIASKVCGALLSLVPSLSIALVGWTTYLIASPYRHWRRVDNEDGIAIVCLVLQYFLLVHFAAFLSLWVKWGALPLAIGIHVLATVVVTSLFLLNVNFQDLFALGITAALLGIPLLQIAIIERFRHLGTQ
jgi:ABC-type transport system involved in multi-copper enzyme maturation permease subunit